MLAHPGELIAPGAIETGRVRRIAVQLDHLLGRNARSLMQVVDVLRNDCRSLARTMERRKGTMPPAGTSCGKLGVHGEAPAPRLVTRLLARHELVEGNRPVLCPHAAGRAEIRNAAFGRDARPGERYDSPGVRDQLAQPSDRSGVGDRTGCRNGSVVHIIMSPATILGRDIASGPLRTRGRPR